MGFYINESITPSTIHHSPLRHFPLTIDSNLETQLISQLHHPMRGLSFLLFLFLTSAGGNENVQHTNSPNFSFFKGQSGGIQMPIQLGEPFASVPVFNDCKMKYFLVSFIVARNWFWYNGKNHRFILFLNTNSNSQLPVYFSTLHDILDIMIIS